MEIEFKTFAVVNGNKVSFRQLEILSSIKKYGSKTATARALGISVPVVHKYMTLMENTVGAKLMISTPVGTKLTETGLKLLEMFSIMTERCKNNHDFTVSCSPVTEELVIHAISLSKVKANVVVSDDCTNIRLLKEGHSDMIILDDPQFLEEVDNFEWDIVGYMDMIHVDNGPLYIKYKYGAQRIAYAQLDTSGKKYEITSETCYVPDLLNSNKSFFIDEILLFRRGVKLKSATEKSLLRHSITAVYRKSNSKVAHILRILQSKTDSEYYLKR
ncbi:MAG: LysR family transcriptional regulator [archaeon]|nr:LysR family transcriptional regulator [archaeon]